MKKEAYEIKVNSFSIRVTAITVLLLLIMSMLSINLNSGHNTPQQNDVTSAQEGNGNGYEAMGANGTNPPISLEYGWNLVSFPYIVSDTSVVNVLSSIDGKYDSVQAYDSSDTNDPWKDYHISKPAFLNDLQNIDNTMGFWIHITDPAGADLVIDGTDPQSQQNITLNKGWNLVGLPRNDYLTIAQVRTDLAGPISIWESDPLGGPQALRALDFDDILNPTKGYWIHSPTTQIWTLTNDGNPPPLPPFSGIHFDFFPTLTYDEVDYANFYGQWISVENENYIGLHFKEKYDTTKITDLSNYAISSLDDPNYSSDQQPLDMSYRWRVAYAPLKEDNLIIAHRIFLHLPNSMVNGYTYEIHLGDIGITVQPMRFTYDDRTMLNENIQINQVGYLPSKDKFAYVGQYMGSAGAIPFSSSTFMVKDFQTDSEVYSGNVVLVKANDPYSGQNIYDMDFSSISTPGQYYIYIPGVGRSHVFQISDDIYNQVSSIYVRGIFHASCGVEQMSPYTRFEHAVDHYQDGTIIETDPKPAWLWDEAYYPNPNGGLYQNTTAGHHDAGDWGKYTRNGADALGYALYGYEAFPDRLQRDDLGFPYSGNGIPDMVDEIKWELDWLEKMQDPTDGGVFSMVKPDEMGYQRGSPSDPENLDRYIYPKDTIFTGAYAAVMALASRSSIINQHFPSDVNRYLQKAEYAWQFLENNSGALDFHHYGDDYGSEDERVWAAVELFAATGESKYHDHFLANHIPDQNKWNWVMLIEGYGMASLAYAFMDVPGMDSSMKTQCEDAILEAGDLHLANSNARAYRLSMDNAPLDYGDFGWFFPQEMIYQLLMANAVQPNPDYEQAALYNMDFIFGANPTGYSHVTGIGSKRFRSIVDQTSRFDGIDMPLPGIMNGFATGMTTLSAYGSIMTDYYPTSSSYPVLTRTFDGWNVKVERTIEKLFHATIGSLYFSTQEPSPNEKPVINSITASVEVGTAPLNVTFTPSVSDSDGSVAQYYWDFGDDQYSTLAQPTHMFREPGVSYQVILTIIDNDGAETFDLGPLIRTKFSQFSFYAEEYEIDANTLALFHFNSNLDDDTGNGYSFGLQGNAQLSNENVLWMNNLTGQSIKFGGFADKATVGIPRADLWNSAGDTLDLEAKIYIEAYDGYSNENVYVFGMYQSYNRNFLLYDGKWDDPHLVVEDPTIETEIMTSVEVENEIPLGEWFQLNLVLDGGWAYVYVNEQKVGELNMQPEFEGSSSDIEIWLGGFVGYVDELRISNVIRNGP